MNQPLMDDDPRRLGPYDITARLGEGGQGVVYLGRTATGEQVAVKLLHHGLLGDPEARNRFLREVEIARRVARFSTAPVLHADLAGQRPYIVSEYVPGPSLRELVTREGPRRGAALERLAISTATALAAIHRAGILHRDFKPANILMGPEGPVVIDFGIARALDAPGVSSTGSTMGTPSYLAPEQLGGEAVTEAADVFAWGVTMVFAASGRPAFGADSTPAVINRILNKEPVITGLDGTLLALVTAGLSKDPARRPGAEDLVAGLTSSHPGRPLGQRVALPGHSGAPAGIAGAEAPSGRSAGPPAVRGRRRRRTLAVTIAGGAAAAALLVTGGVLLNSGGDDPAGSSPAVGDATPQPAVRPTTAAATVASTKTERRTPPPAPKRTPHLRTPAPTAKPARTGRPVVTLPDDEPRRDATTAPPSGTTVPDREPETTAAPPPPWQQPTMENPFTCIPQVC
ncbi:serine/threonine-protein kinase [Nonomuraea montanisoli]|uniref:serine/threonine-protein kinase n=1 Tax=Nonomuraea montanisoli TaxID=2741721 RepID=UPI002E2CDA8C|nr:serine/threonine-protein kinase [Nonomuraea montanisoli]